MLPSAAVNSICFLNKALLQAPFLEIQPTGTGRLTEIHIP